jgi:hypothetical protein
LRLPLLARLTPVLLITGALAAAAQPQARSDERFLVVMLLRTRIQIELILADIEKSEQEIEANRRIIETAEKKLQNAKETFNRQAAIVPANDLRRARAAQRSLSKAQSQRQKALAGAEGVAAVLKGMLASDRSGEADRTFAAIATSVSGRATILKKDGANDSLKEGKAGFLGPGDEISSPGGGQIEVQAFDGRAIIHLHGGSRLKIEEDGLQAQTLRLVQGKLSALVETPAALDRTVRERFQGPDNDLTPLLRRYVDLAGADSALSGEKTLRIRIPDAVCAVTEARIHIEIMARRTTEIVASEGTVEVSDLRGEKRVLLEEGYGIAVTKDRISAPLKKQL